MNRDDIVRMAKEAWGEGNVYRFDSPKHWPEVEEMFVRFATLVAATEREACASLCFQMWDEWMDEGDKSEFSRPDAEDCARAIRARGQE